GDGVAAERGDGPLQRRLPVLPPESKTGGDGGSQESVGGGVQGLELDTPRPRPRAPPRRTGIRAALPGRRITARGRAYLLGDSSCASFACCASVSTLRGGRAMSA